MKTMKIINYLILACCTAFLVSCQQQELLKFDDKAGVYFELPGVGGVGIRDSLVFSFPAITAAETILPLRVRLMGQAMPVARSFTIGVVADSTTAGTANYSLPATIEIPANAFYVDVPLTIKRVGLLDTFVRLELEIIPNENFQVGFNRGRTTVVVWGDMFLRPDNWPAFNAVWGPFSRTKYGFILTTLGLTEFPLPPPANIYLWVFYNATVRAALNEHNQANPGNPLLDENGAPMSFPIYNVGGGGG